MAKSAWGIELGTSSVKAVKITGDRGGTTLEAISTISLSDFGLDAGTPVEQATTAALNQLRGSHGIKRGDNVFVSISGQNTLGRILNLPPVSKAEERITVENEARSNLPIKLDEAVWDYQVIEEVDADGDKKVNLYAAKREAVLEVVGICESAGIAVTGIQVAPLGLYNYVKYEFDDEVSDSCVAIDIGADNTDVVIIDGQKTYVRVVPVAGNDITKALRSRFKLSAEDAERLKKRAAKSKDAAAVFEAMKPPLKEMVGEIYRAVGFYKNQHEEANISQLVMMGNGAKLLNIRKFFEQQLQYRCHKLESPARISLSRSVDPSELQSDIHSLAVAIGLALQAVEVPGVNYINLIPPEVLEAREKEKLKMPFMVGGALAALGGIVALVLGIMAGSGASAQIDQATTTADSASKQQEAYQKSINYTEDQNAELSIRNVAEGIIGHATWSEGSGDEKVTHEVPLTVSSRVLPGMIAKRVIEGISAYNEKHSKSPVYMLNGDGSSELPSQLGKWASNFVMVSTPRWEEDAGSDDDAGYFAVDRKLTYSIYLARDAGADADQAKLQSDLASAFKGKSKYINGPILESITKYLEDSGQLEGLSKKAKMNFGVTVEVIIPKNADKQILLKEFIEVVKMAGDKNAVVGSQFTRNKSIKMAMVRVDIEIELKGSAKPSDPSEDG